MSDPSTEQIVMDISHSWTSNELEVFTYIQELVRIRQVKLSSDVEPFLRRKFHWVTMNSAYHLAMTYGRYRQKIDTILAEQQKADDPENVKANCCRTCEATS